VGLLIQWIFFAFLNFLARILFFPLWLSSNFSSTYVALLGLSYFFILLLSFVPNFLLYRRVRENNIYFARGILWAMMAFAGVIIFLDILFFIHPPGVGGG